MTTEGVGNLRLYPLVNSPINPLGEPYMVYVNVYIPGTCVSSILVVEPSKTRSNFQSKTRVIWGLYIHLFSEVSELIQLRKKKKKTQSTPKFPQINGNPSPLATKKKTPPGSKAAPFSSWQQDVVAQDDGARVYTRKFKTSKGMYQMMDVYNS